MAAKYDFKTSPDVLEELGTLSATVTCRKVTKKSEIGAASVHFDNMKFKPT